MASPILSTTEYPAIRAALDLNLTSNDLPDATIGLNIYKLAAEQDVLDLDPDAETRIGTDGERVLRAAIYFCAARLAPVVVQIASISIQTRDLNYSSPPFDPIKRAAELREMANDEIDEVLGTETDFSGMAFGVIQQDYQQTDRTTDLP